MLKPNQARDAAQPGLGSGSALHAGLFIMHQAVHSTSFRSVAAVVVARSDSDMIHNTAVINLTYLGLALDGIVPGIAWWLTRAFSSFALCCWWSKAARKKCKSLH